MLVGWPLRRSGTIRCMGAEDQAKLDQLWEQMQAVSARMKAAAAGPERDEWLRQLGALYRSRAQLWSDVYPADADYLRLAWKRNRPPAKAEQLYRIRRE